MPFIISALQLTPAIVAAGEDIVQFVDWALSVWNSPAGPQSADWDLLHQKETALRNQLA